MYRRFNNLKEFYEKKPDPSSVQRELLRAFYSARRDHNPEQKVPSSLLRQHAEPILYETDLAIWIMQKLDDQFMELRIEKIKQDLEKHKTHGR
jgi:hypothetical protein